MRFRRPGRRYVPNRGLVVLVVLAALVFAQRTTPGLSLATRALAREWVSCLLAGEPPENAFTMPVPAVQRPTAGRSSPDTPDEALLDPRWGADLLGISRLDTPPSLADITVAVIDSGIDARHPVFGDAVRPGLDLLNPCGDGRTDHRGHGTQVAGVIAALPGNAGGIVGAATGVQLLPVRVGALGQRLRWLDAAAIVWAVQHGADVINISASSRSDRPSRVEHAAIRYAVSRGVVVVASAGNIPGALARFPAAYPEVISVTAVDLDRALPPVTIRGKVDIAAPGDVMVVAAPGGRYTRAWGTSFAVPYVSAVAARMKAADPSLTPGQVRRVLMATARPVKVAPGQRPPSFGVVDPAAALAAVGAPQPLMLAAEAAAGSG